MKELNQEELRRLQHREYEILVEFDRICKKHDIKYFLDAGTLLGAVRHKGFIPWDDDIDIGMFRRDYNKFRAIVDKELRNKFFYQDCYNDEGYGLTYGKIRLKNTVFTEKITVNTKARDGIFIDIFPFDNASKHEFINKIDFLRVVMLRVMLMLKKNYLVDNDTLVKRIEIVILKFLSRILSDKMIIKKIDKITNKYYYKKTGYVTNYSTAYLNKYRLERNWFRDKELSLFEKDKFYIISNYDPYLKYLYNDYMRIPDENERRIHSLYDIKFGKGDK